MTCRRWQKAGMALLCLLLPGQALADPVLGMWKTQPDDGAYAHVQMHPCGSDICGTIQRTFKNGSEYASPNKGKILVRHMTPKGGGAYEGKVWRPSNDKVYLGKMHLNGKRLTLKGCVAGGLLCSGQIWTRLK